MQTETKQFILAACLSATIACAGLTGCASHERSVGTRLDDRMTARRVSSDLADAPVYKFPEVRVQVYDGIAQLTGFVDTKEQALNAAEIASHSTGVRQVLNDIALKPQQGLAPVGYRFGQQYQVAPTSPSTPQPNTSNSKTQTPTTPNNLNNQNQNSSTPNQP